MKRDPQASSLVSSIAEFVRGTGFGDLPDTVSSLARRHVLDTIGSCLAAVRLETSRSLASYLMSEGGAGQGAAVSISQKMPAPHAPLTNGPPAPPPASDALARPGVD